MDEHETGMMTVTESSKRILPVLIAAGSSMAAVPAAALELGDIQVNSTLGQPLRASIAYALAPNEQLADYCVSLVPMRQSAGVPAVSSANVRVANGIISLTGTRVMNEPLVALRVNVSCPYSPKLAREYTLFIDPAGTTRPAAATATTRRPVAQAEPVATAKGNAAPAPRRPAAPLPSLETASRYRVQPGDSVSRIVQRIPGRNVDMWTAIAQIQAANPHAFIDGDPNKLMAGVVLAIPEFSANSAADLPPAAPVATPRSAAATVAAASPASAAAAAVEPGTEPVEPMPAISPLATSTVNETAAIELIDVQVTVPAKKSLNVPVATIQPAPAPAETDSRPASLWWMVGGGLALLAGLLVFLRRQRDDELPLDGPAKEASHPLRRATDTGAVRAVVADDYDLDDDSPTSENMILDADLGLGTGLGSGTDISVTEDFGFDTSADLDLEFPAEPISEADAPVTDIIAAPRVEQSSILDSEILPDDEDYDMSVLMDATKMPDTAEVTERDLKAVVVETGDETVMRDSYTIASEVDYQVLEQDYEDELSATQALNLEIEKAAAELAERLDNGEDVSSAESAITANLQQPGRPLATVTPIDSAARDAAGETGEQGIDATDALELIDDTDEISYEDKTSELPASGNNKSG